MFSLSIFLSSASTRFAKWFFGLLLIINFDCPYDAADYVHRVGRTARAETKGEAITLINPKDMKRFDRIEKLIETVIDKKNVPEKLGNSPEWKIIPFKKRYNANSKHKK